MRVKIALLSILILVLSACSSNKVNEVPNPSTIATSDLNKVKEYSRGAVSEFQKLLEGQNTSFSSYEELFSHYDLNKQLQEDFRKYINNQERKGYLKSIIFIPASEIVYKKDNRFVYQITTEVIRRENSESIVKNITFELSLTKTKLGTIQLQDVSFKEGHSLDGQKEIAENAVDDITKEKLDILMKNVLGVEVKDEENAKSNISSMFKENAFAAQFIEDFNIAEQKNQKYVYSRYETTETHIKGEIPSLVSKGKYTIEYINKDGKTITNSYEISITLEQDNPESNYFGYSISNIEIKKLILK